MEGKGKESFERCGPSRSTAVEWLRRLARRVALPSILIGSLAIQWPTTPVASEGSHPPPFAAYRLVGEAWVPYRQNVRPDERILILTHGVLENLHSAFPAKVALQIKRFGGYDDVLGISYDWAERTTTIAPYYAAFLRKIPSRRIDIEAHSYGTLQSLAALESAQIVPKNVVLLGAPLGGTPFAYETNLTRALLRLPPQAWNGNIGKFQRMRASGATADLRPGSRLQRDVIPPFIALVKTHHVHVIMVAGSDRFQLGLAANLYFQIFGLECPACHEPSDGVISVASALGDKDRALAGLAIDQRIFPVRHARLKNDPQVLKFVARHLAR